MTAVPLMKPHFPNLSAVTRRFEIINQAGVFSNFGAQTEELARRFEDFLGAAPETVVPVSNATAGIQAAVATLGGKKWAVPSWTFTATVAGALAAGAELVFADIDPVTQWINPSSNSELDGVVATAPFGSGFNEARLDTTFPLVIDAAASIAARMPPLSRVPEHVIVVFSLHATKVLGIGEGGLVVCGTAEVAREVKSRVNFGFAGDRESQHIGSNGKMSEFAAAIGNVVLDNWDEEREQWLKARKKVNALTEELGARSLFSDSEAISPYWLIETESPDQRELIEMSCAELGVQTRQWWGKGCHAMPAYEEIPGPPLPFTDSIATRYLGLPFFRGISDLELLAVRSAIENGLLRA